MVREERRRSYDTSCWRVLACCGMMARRDVATSAVSYARYDTRVQAMMAAGYYEAIWRSALATFHYYRPQPPDLSFTIGEKSRRRQSRALRSIWR